MDNVAVPVQKELRNRLKAKARQPSAVSLGRLIAAERNRQGLSQHDLARAVDCPDSMIANFEADRRAYWVKLREIIEFLAPRAGKLWLKQSTQILMGKIDALVWDEPDPIRRLMLAEWLRSSGDRAVASSTGTHEEYLPGFRAGLKEPQHTRHHAA